MRLKTLLFLFLFLPSLPVFAQVSEEELIREAEEARKAEEEKKKETDVNQEREPPAETPAEEKKEGDLGFEAYKIKTEIEINLSYVFAESPDTFFIKYKTEFEEELRNRVDIVTGTARFDTTVEGFLAKWPTGECLLSVKVAEAPYEIVFTKTGEEEVKLDYKFPDTLLENWESNCTFKDSPGKKFSTTGNPEHWLIRGINKIRGDLRGRAMSVDRLHKETREGVLTIERFLIPDPPLGSVELDGKVKISIIPQEL